MRILIIGAGGYVGGRLVPRLLGAGHELTLVSRQPALVANRFPGARVLAADPRNHLSLGVALRELADPLETIYHLPETIVRFGSAAWAEEIRVAETLGAAAAAAGARRIVHLGELGDAPVSSATSAPGAPSDRGAALALAGTPVMEFRSSLIIGSGSAPFEMVRHLADRIPVMTTPRWVGLPAQPIGVRDVLGYLLAALERETTGVAEIGGPEVLSFAEMLLRYARSRGLRRIRIPLPVATAWASDAWISLISPLPRGVAGAIIERLQHGAVVRQPVDRTTFEVEPMPYAEALRLAQQRTTENRVETTWFDTFETRHRRPAVFVGAKPEGRRILIDRREREVTASPERVFAEVERLGGPAGWPSGNVFWRLRGLIDRAVGGVGMRLGRRDQDHLRVGDALDFWRVEALERPRLLRLRAEMRVPGRAWLQFSIEPAPAGSRLVQAAYFDPDGVAGYLYWYVLLPIHVPIFRGMVRALGERAMAARSREHPTDGTTS